MSDRAKEALRAESANLAATAHDIAFSGAYLYPFKGIVHLASRPPLYTPLLHRSLQTLTLGLSITTSLFVFTYIPQSALVALLTGPLAFLSPLTTALLILAESAALTHFLARGWILSDALIDIFDAVLLDRGCDALVARGREVKGLQPGRGDAVVSRLGKVLKKPRFVGEGGLSGWATGLVRSLVLLPLNFVPLVGTVGYVYVSGKKAGPGLHDRYFQLRGLSRAEREEWVEERRGAYTGLGMASVLLEMVPFVSIVFEFSNAVGAALWAADLEKARE
ncbi:hypothetical protein BJY01DRAFT_124694 [Aspergillus pseudoustus]|uniref:Etoposide-induced protein 2.4-domain-containing protein n=1 Tax=Aspergillus pseudoustus TaxID=1810923 RepID=A0ABR4INQ4_9EURO